jgi:hypothetical protein
VVDVVVVLLVVVDVVVVDVVVVLLLVVVVVGGAGEAATTFIPNDCEAQSPTGADHDEPPSADDSVRNDGVGETLVLGAAALHFQLSVPLALPVITTKYVLDPVSAIGVASVCVCTSSVHAPTACPVTMEPTCVAGVPLLSDQSASEYELATDALLVSLAFRTQTRTSVRSTVALPVVNDCASHLLPSDRRHPPSFSCS